MIPIKSKEEIRIMAEGGKILASIMKELEKKVKQGITTKTLDRAATALILKYGGKPSFKGHENYPATLCTSINEQLVHCLPSKQELKKGDIVSLDIGMQYKGFHTDMAITLPVGEIPPEAQRLIKVTKKALKRGIKKVRPGNTFGDIGNIIQRYVESQGFNVVRDLCGHGIGKEIHEDPKILNYGIRHSGPKIKKGMVFCLEPMVTIGDWKIKKIDQPPTRSEAGSKDSFGYETADGSLSCHFEHTVAVTQKGCQVLTKI